MQASQNKSNIFTLIDRGSLLGDNAIGSDNLSINHQMELPDTLGNQVNPRGSSTQILEIKFP